MNKNFDVYSTIYFFSFLYRTFFFQMQADDETPTRIEQYWEADSADEDKLKSAFPIDDDSDHHDAPDAPDTPDAPVPSSAEEYIRSVRREAAALPDVFTTKTTVAEQTTRVIPLTITLAPTPDHLRPCETWVNSQLETFRSLQSRLKKKKKNGTQDININSDTAHNHNHNLKDANSWKRLFHTTTQPNSVLSSALNSADFTALATGLRAFDEALPDDGSGAKAKWLYELLARIAPPLDGNTAATMRSILRKLTYARLNVASTESSELGALNLLISIMSIHFKQG